MLGIIKVPLEKQTMNIKRIFGVILTLLGIAGLIYTAVLLSGSMNGGNVKTVAIYGVLGAIFFIAGIGLVRTMKDEA